MEINNIKKELRKLKKQDKYIENNIIYEIKQHINKINNRKKILIFNLNNKNKSLNKKEVKQKISEINNNLNKLDNLYKNIINHNIKIERKNRINDKKSLKYNIIFNYGKSLPYTRKDLFRSNKLNLITPLISRNDFKGSVFYLSILILIIILIISFVAISCVFIYIENKWYYFDSFQKKLPDENLKQLTSEEQYERILEQWTVASILKGEDKNKPNSSIVQTLFIMSLDGHHSIKLQRIIAKSLNPTIDIYAVAKTTKTEKNQLNKYPKAEAFYCCYDYDKKQLKENWLRYSNAAKWNSEETKNGFIDCMVIGYYYDPNRKYNADSFSVSTSKYYDQTLSNQIELDVGILAPNTLEELSCWEYNNEPPLLRYLWISFRNIMPYSYFHTHHVPLFFAKQNYNNIRSTKVFFDNSNNKISKFLENKKVITWEDWFLKLNDFVCFKKQIIAFLEFVLNEKINNYLLLITILPKLITKLSICDVFIENLEKIYLIELENYKLLIEINKVLNDLRQNENNKNINGFNLLINEQGDRFWAVTDIQSKDPIVVFYNWK
jgi:hypothetical protein